MMVALGEDLCRIHDWQFLEREVTFAGDGVNNTFDLPADFGRIVNQTLWETKQSVSPVSGGHAPAIWGWFKYGMAGAGIVYRYRIVRNKLEVYPLPAAGAEFSFTYITKMWVKSQANSEKDTVNTGTDVPQFDRRLMVSGLKSRLWGQKGFDTTHVDREFNMILLSEKGVSQGASVISLNRGIDSFYLSGKNVPDTGYG